MDSEKNITVNGKEITLKKIALTKYPAIISSVQDLSSHKELFGDMSQGALLSALPQIILVAQPSVIKVASTISEVPEEEVSQWGLDDLVRVLEGVLEINNFEYIYHTLKKAMARLNTATAPVQELQPTESSN